MAIDLTALDMLPAGPSGLLPCGWLFTCSVTCWSTCDYTCDITGHVP
jgi:hypothetical protein